MNLSGILVIIEPILRFRHVMDSPTPELVETLTSTIGLVAVAITALYNRERVKDSVGEIGKLIEKGEARFQKRIGQLESGLSFIKSKIELVEKILADDLVEESELQEARKALIEIKELVANLFSFFGREDV